MIFTLRTTKTQARYEAFLAGGPYACFFCRNSFQLPWKYWHLLPNDFPYDGIAAEHALIAPIRHVADLAELTSAEMLEWYEVVRPYLNEHYHLIMENTTARKTIDHFHWHALTYKDKR